MSPNSLHSTALGSNSIESAISNEHGPAARAAGMLYDEYTEALYAGPHREVSTPGDFDRDTAPVWVLTAEMLCRHPDLVHRLVPLLANAASARDDTLASLACNLIHDIATRFAGQQAQQLSLQGAFDA
jgi:hypothetical protein